MPIVFSHCSASVSDDIYQVLINGGLGVSSQLQKINQLMIKSNRRLESEYLTAERLHSHSDESPKINGDIRVVACDEALRFLTQVQHSATVKEDFVSDLTVGGGRGISQRNRAVDSAEDRFRTAREDVDGAVRETAELRRKRAKAHWHLALEHVTTGILWKHPAASAISPEILRLWKWRYVTIRSRPSGIGGRQKLPQLLVRGWRPSLNFLRKDLYASRPEFNWAHPFALRLEEIPKEVTPAELKEAVHEATKRGPSEEQVASSIKTKSQKEFDSSSKEKPGVNKNGAETNVRAAKIHDIAMKKPEIIRSGESSETWTATLHFHTEGDFRFVLKRASLANGFALKSNALIPNIEKATEVAKSNLLQAESENKVCCHVM